MFEVWSSWPGLPSRGLGVLAPSFVSTALRMRVATPIPRAGIPFLPKNAPLHLSRLALETAGRGRCDGDNPVSRHATSRNHVMTRISERLLNG